MKKALAPALAILAILVFSCAGSAMTAEQYTARLEKLAEDHAAAVSRGDSTAAESALKEFQAEDPSKHGLSGKDFTAGQEARIAAAGLKVLANAGVAAGADLGKSFGEALGKDLGKGLGEFFGAFSKEFTDAFKKASDDKAESAPEGDASDDAAPGTTGK